MITKFKLFEINSDIDPYSEEDWDDVDLVNITMKTPIKIGDMIYTSSDMLYGKVERIETNGEELYVNVYGDVQYCSKPFLSIFSYKIKVNKQFEHNELDPYNEEDWDDDNENKITIRKFYHDLDNDILYRTRYWVYRLSDRYILRYINNYRQCSFRETDDPFTYTERLNDDDINSIKSGEAWITNDYDSDVNVFEKWKYEDIVKIFGEENIVL